MIKLGDVVWAINFWVKYKVPPQSSPRILRAQWSRELAEALVGVGLAGPDPDPFLVIGYGDEPGTLVVLSAQGAVGVLEERNVIENSHKDSEEAL